MIGMVINFVILSPWMIHRGDILTKGTKLTYDQVQTGIQTGQMTIKNLVYEHVVALRNALVAVPALVSSFVLSAHSLI